MAVEVIRGRKIDTKVCTGVAYKRMAEFATIKACWGCGQRIKPPWWNAIWIQHRAHLVNQPRAEDRRAVILLCPECHGESHGEKYSDGQSLKPLTLPHMLWIKRKFDPWFYDRSFLAKHKIGKLPQAEPLGSERLRLLKSRGVFEVTNDQMYRELEAMLSC